MLETAGGLLEQYGFDALTTNLIASEAGLWIRGIYRYFPNKHAIVAELARKMEAQWGSALADVGTLDDPSVDWRKRWLSYIDAFVGCVRATPGGRAVLVAMRSEPALRQIDDEVNRSYIKGLEEALLARSSNISKREATMVATVMIRSTVAILDEVFESKRESSELIETMKIMQIGLLERHLD